MKVIDILNKIANGTLEDGFKFKYDSDIYRYNKEKNEIRSIEYDESLVEYYKIETILNKEVEVIEENKEIEELGFIEETVKYCDGTGHTNKVNNMASYSDIVISTNEYRPCFVFSQKALFHRWIIKHEMVYKDEYVKGLVEFENGHVAEVDKEDIQFCDNKFKEYNFKEREEK